MSARFRWGGERGHVQVAGIGRYIAWDDLNPVAFNLGGHTWGWGVNLSSNVPVAKKDVIKLSATYGHGVENYMNDNAVNLLYKRGYELRHFFHIDPHIIVKAMQCPIIVHT